MKKSRIFILMLVFIFGVGGCSSSSYDYTVQYRDISQSKIFVDYEENVMYTWYKNGYGAGMSVMLRANGLPKLFDPIDSKYTTVYDISKAKIFVDFETNVMYAWYKNGYGAGMTVMLKADGTPKLYDPLTSKYTAVHDISKTRLFVDYEEDVMYTWYKNGYGAGMSVMLNSDGSPKLYNPLTSRYSQVHDISIAKFFVDYDENVMYAWYKNGYGAGMSVMLKANGLPKLYTSSTKYTKIDNILKSRLFVDYEEYVMYAWYKNGYGAGMSVMLDADGTAKTFQQ